MSKLTLRIVTPEGEAFSGEADYVTLPGSQGELGVYPNHERVMTTLAAGELDVRNGENVLHLAVGEGFAEIGPDSVRVMTEIALRESEIDVRSAEEAIARAKEALARAEKMTEDDVAATRAMLSRSLAQLNVKRRKRV
ncbi:MAG TPA: ATP synthase F1 subunit epsilon [Verrucomicrobiae bacterium]|nr:ATP synthase F1 subunit epsilon [Verrucomicrobiae bacterium]